MVALGSSESKKAEKKKVGQKRSKTRPHLLKCKIRKRMDEPWVNDLWNDRNLGMNRISKNEKKIVQFE